MMKAPILTAAGALVTSRRNFLVRAFGLTAAGATCAVPIITLADARACAEHHLKGLEQAYRDLDPGAAVCVRTNNTPPEDVLDLNRRSIACAIVMADRLGEFYGRVRG